MMRRCEMRQLLQISLFALLLAVTVFALNRRSVVISKYSVDADDMIRSVKEERDNISLQLNRLQVQ